VDLESRDLDRVIEGDVLNEIEFDSMSGVLEPAVSLAVPSDIGGFYISDRRRGGSPQLAGIFVTQKDDLARPIGHRVV
jgi:hypothetical protein